ncbi:MAG: pyrroloquinoline quinone-dependent dehydrogenase [Acidobacteria bacterium]|nr:pyrroloquinoline quinone-dependent dehydrogenase [Acidobacteriota bacterium]
MQAKHVILATVIGAVVVVTCARTAVAQYGAPADGEWRTYGGDLGSTKYSPLAQITRDNFEQLEVKWRWQSPDGMLSKSTPGGGEWVAPIGDIVDALNEEDPDRWRDNNAPHYRNFKPTPIMANGTLYVNTPLSIGAAIDARTGQTRWIYNPKSYEEGTTTMSLTWSQRGVGYWDREGPERARVVWGTGNGYLVCVLASTGHPCDDFGVDGRVDLMEGIPRAERGARDWLNALLYSVQSPPLVVRDTIITPASISSYNNTKAAPPGWIRGFDVKTGRVNWVFHTIPQADEFGNDSWAGDSWRDTGKVGVWTQMSFDEELGYLYLPTNTAAPDYYGGHRVGNNLFAESLIALDVETGERVWHFQILHHGLWDYDLPAAPNLMDITVDGRPVKAVVQVTKQGFVFAFDRVTGEPIWPIEERAVPFDTDIEGEVPSTTQPFPTRPAPFEYQGVTIDDLVDFTPEIRQLAVDAVSAFRLGPLYTPHSDAGTIFRPSAAGGGNWGGGSVDPDTGIIYIPSHNAWSVMPLRKTVPEDDSTLTYIQNRRGARLTMPRGLPLFKPPYSRMTAIDMNTGEHVWMTPTGEGSRYRRNPMLRDLDLPPLGGDATRNGPLVTKTLLLYTLTAGGTNDGPRLVAYDKATGAELASIDLPSAGVSTPMTYMLDGKQYIGLTVGGDPPELIALGLPD